MRTTVAFMAAALVLAPAIARGQEPAASSQTPPATVPPGAYRFDLPTSNFVEFGVRGTVFGENSDEARFQRYRDLRNGPTIDLFRYADDTERHLFRIQADHVGYRDQRYSIDYNQFGKLKASFEWDQIPLFFSQDTATLYTSPTPGTLLLDDSIQSALQNRTTTLPIVAAGATPFDLRHTRYVGDFKMTYSATRNMEFNLWLKNTGKHGQQPWAGSFGQSNSVELPLPVDTRTTELGAVAEWTNSHGLVRIGYDGSFFRNQTTTLIWDNPQRVTDSPTAGPVQGREAYWPNSDLNAGSVTGLLKLPHRSQATGYVSLGRWSQNDILIPFTINSALPTIAVDRPTAETKADVASTAFAFNSRPTDKLWLNARFRSYEYDNRAPIFHMTQYIAYDTSVATFAEGATSPYSHHRRTFDADASFTPMTYASFRAGYTHERIEQTFRSFDTTAEDILRLSVDSTRLGWLTVRGVYERSQRIGSGFDETALDDIGEQVSLRQFDISDRYVDRFSSIVLLMPTSEVSFNGLLSVGREDRPDGEFGLRSNDNHAYSFGMDYVPRNAVSMGFSYNHEFFTTLQRSRQANPGPQFDDPTRDWTTDADDTADTLTASLDLLQLIRRTDIRLAYDMSVADSTYVYGLTPDTTLGPIQQLPTVTNKFQRATLDVRRALSSRVSAGFAYWYDRYQVNDFALGQETLSSLVQGNFMMLGYLYRPYKANTFSARVTYFW